LERETSTILRIKVAKAIITPRAMHASAKDNFFLHTIRSRIAAHLE
jgi:hypothetical protein